MTSLLQTFTGNEARATELAKDHLTLQGWLVAEPNDDLGDFTWEKPRDFCDRLKISHSHFYRRMEHTECPAFQAERGKTGRITKLKSNFQLERWMQKK